MRVRFFSLVESFNRTDEAALKVWEDAEFVPRRRDYVYLDGADWRVDYVIWRHDTAADVVCGRLDYRM